MHGSLYCDSNPNPYPKPNNNPYPDPTPTPTPRDLISKLDRRLGVDSSYLCKIQSDF